MKTLILLIGASALAATAFGQAAPAPTMPAKPPVTAPRPPAVNTLPPTVNTPPPAANTPPPVGNTAPPAGAVVPPAGNTPPPVPGLNQNVQPGVVQPGVNVQPNLNQSVQSGFQQPLNPGYQNPQLYPGGYLSQVPTNAMYNQNNPYNGAYNQATNGYRYTPGWATNTPVGTNQGPAWRGNNAYPTNAMMR